jgi:anti-anti-sigma factor
MTYAIHEHQDIQVIQIHSLFNELDNQSILKDFNYRLHSGKSAFIVDLSELTYVNSIGLNLLILLMSSARKTDTYLALANASEQVIKLLKVTKLYTVFHLTPTVEEALQEIESF